MTWFKLDDGWHNHPKVLAAGNAAAGLWARCGSYSSQQLLDGFVPMAIALSYGSRKEVARVTAAGLWQEAEGGFLMPDFLDFNPSAEKVRAERVAAKERQRKHRESRRDEHRESHDPDPTRPDPTDDDFQQQPESYGPDPRLAAALDQHTAYRVAQGDVRSAPRLRSKLWGDHAAALRRFLLLHPDCTHIDLAVDVLGMERPRPTLVPRQPCADPDCVNGNLVTDPTNADVRRHTQALPCPVCKPADAALHRTEEIAQ